VGGRRDAAGAAARRLEEHRGFRRSHGSWLAEVLEASDVAEAL
jgi:hypothetical protein